MMYVHAYAYDLTDLSAGWMCTRIEYCIQPIHTCMRMKCGCVVAAGHGHASMRASRAACLECLYVCMRVYVGVTCMYEYMYACMHMCAYMNAYIHTFTCIKNVHMRT